MFYSVCIIGAGPAGLATANALLDLGIDDIVVFEAGGAVGGLWRAPQAGGFPWRCDTIRPDFQMRTNLSKFKCEFSDLRHAPTTPLYPNATHMQQYFEKYVDERSLRPKIFLHHRVVSVTPMQNVCDGPLHGEDGWQLEVTADVMSNGAKGDEPSKKWCRCRHVVVCTGVFSEPRIPDVLQASFERSRTALSKEKEDGSRKTGSLPRPIVVHSQGLDLQLLHDVASTNVPSPDKSNEPAVLDAQGEATLTERSLPPRVLIIGNAYSGADLASAISKSGLAATPIDVVCRRSRWYVSRWMTADGVCCVAPPRTDLTETKCSATALPWDVQIETRSRFSQPAYLPSLPHYALHAWAASCTRYLPMPVPVNKENDSFLTVICDSFREDVDRLALRVLREIPPHLTDPPAIPTERPAYDVIICATGYDCRLPFLCPELLTEIQFDPHDSFLPLIAYKSTLHPTRNNIFFVGLYRGPYLFALEINARWVAHLIAGAAAFPSPQKRSEYLALEETLRRTRGATPSCGTIPHGFPHRNVTEFVDLLAEEFGAKPTDSQVNRALMSDVVLTGLHYRCCEVGMGEKERVTEGDALRRVPTVEEFRKMAKQLQQETTVLP